MMRIPRTCALGVLILVSSLAAAVDKPPTPDPTYGLPAPKPTVMTEDPEARIIWFEKTVDIQTVYFRKTFSIDSLPAHATFYLAADNLYELFVNGKRVAGTTDPERWTEVTEINVTPSLKTGKNVVAIVGKNTGGPAGLIARLDIDGKPLVLSDTSWKTWGVSALPATWIAADYDDATWRPARDLAHSDAWAGLDGWPWRINHPKALPTYLARLELPPVKIVDIHPGDGNIETGDAFALKVKLAPLTSSNPPSVTFDFGKELSAELQIFAATPSRARIELGESLEEVTQSPWAGQRIRLPGGKWSAGSPTAFRFAKIIFLGAAGFASDIVVNGVRASFRYYPVDYIGSFASSDGLLDRIWYTGAYTAHLCMQDQLFDGIKRNRGIFAADVRVLARTLATVFGKSDLVHKALTTMRAEAQGDLVPYVYPRNHVNGIPGYSSEWIEALADDYRTWGDRDYLKQQRELLLSLLNFMENDVDQNHLFVNRQQSFLFVDLVAGLGGDDNLAARRATHLHLVKGAREAAFLFEAMGDRPNQVKYTAWGDALTTSARRFLFDEKAQTYGERRQENAMAIESGVASGALAQSIAQNILLAKAPVGAVTPYYAGYVIDALSRAGQTSAALQFVREYWGGMLASDSSTFWETYDPSLPKTSFHGAMQPNGFSTSLSHGWASGVTSWLTERVLGVRSTGAGFQTFEIAPELGDLKWVKGTVPSPNGLIRVEANPRELTISIPPGTTAAVKFAGKQLVVPGPVTDMRILARSACNRSATMPASADQRPLLTFDASAQPIYRRNVQTRFISCP